MGEDAVLRDVVGAADLGPLLVATAAKKGDIETSHLRIGGVRLFYVMGAVAVPAAGGQPGAGADRPPMQAAVVNFFHV